MCLSASVCLSMFVCLLASVCLYLFAYRCVSLSVCVLICPSVAGLAGTVESFVEDCSDGDEEPLINNSGAASSRVPCRWQRSVKVKDYGMWNMRSCLCCCWMIAIAGLYKSLKCQSAKRKGLYKSAEQYSSQARILFWVSFLVGALIWIIIAAVYGFLIVAYLKMMTGGMTDTTTATNSSADSAYQDYSY